MFRSAWALLACTVALPVSSLTLMPMGDSITLGYHGSNDVRGSYRQTLSQKLDEAGVDYDFVGQFSYSKLGLSDANVQAVAGYSIEQMTATYGPAVAAYKPDVILLLAGTNNYRNNPETDDLVGKYTELLDMIHSNSPQSRVIMATVPKIGYDRIDKEYWTHEWVDARNNVSIAALNDAIYTVASLDGRVSVVDFHAALDPQTDLVPYVDLVHPTGVGQDKLAELYYQGLSEITLTTVPEPTSAAMLALLGVAAISRRRRQA